MEYKNIDISSIMGFPVNEWTTLSSIRKISLYSNNYIYPDPFSAQFYIDHDAGVIFARYTTGKPLELLSEKDLKPGYAKVEVDGKLYQIKIVGGGMKDSKIGIFHDVYGTDNIQGFFK